METTVENDFVWQCKPLAFACWPAGLQPPDYQMWSHIHALGPGIHTLIYHTAMYRMAGNIGGEFNLAVWRMGGQSAKLKSAKHSAHGDFDDLVKSANLKKMGKWRIRQILFPPIFPAIRYIYTYVCTLLLVLYSCTGVCWDCAGQANCRRLRHVDRRPYE